MSSAQSNKDKLILARLKADFVAFLFVLWKALNLPKPTRCQIDMSKTLASGKQRRFILQAFRGIGKSFITFGHNLTSLVASYIHKGHSTRMTLSI